MKGRHLAGKDDADDKKALLNLMSSVFAIESMMQVSELDLVEKGGFKVE